MVDVGLNDINCAQLDDLAAAIRRDKAFARGDGEGQGPRHFHQTVDVFRPARLFIPIEIVVYEEPAELDGGGGGGASMKVEHDIHFIAGSLAHGFHAAR